MRRAYLVPLLIAAAAPETASVKTQGAPSTKAPAAPKQPKLENELDRQLLRLLQGSEEEAVAPSSRSEGSDGS